MFSLVVCSKDLLACSNKELTLFVSIENDSNEETIYDELNCCVEEFIDRLPKQYSSSLKGVYLDELTQKEYAEQNSKQMRKLSTFIAVASVICKNTSMLNFVPASSTSDSKQISDKDVVDILKSFDVRRFNREVQDKKDQRNNRRNKK